MSAELFIYLAYVIDSIGHVLFLARCISFLIAIFFGLVGLNLDPNDKEHQKFIAIGKKYAVITGILMLINSFLPTERTLYMIAGAHLGKEAIQSETAQKIQKIIDGKLDAYIKELESKK